MDVEFLQILMARILSGEIKSVKFEACDAIGTGKDNRLRAFASVQIDIDGQSDLGTFTIGKCVQATDLFGEAYKMMARAGDIIGTE